MDGLNKKTRIPCPTQYAGYPARTRLARNPAAGESQEDEFVWFSSFEGTARSFTCD
ncbi:hypothetical protein AALP_AA2G002800 [Arabis alpina]|uniref:Uncharacterized protein n=1 Tax=Arabis alpina TaxID=50452 RepID=A0A087HEE0_ARAAL|nr:hypothetical protein AALP_AA2G002800 [Arabis alpina]